MDAIFGVTSEIPMNIKIDDRPSKICGNALVARPRAKVGCLV